MKDIIEVIYKEEKLCCVYKNAKNTEKFFLGMIQKIGCNQILFESMDLEGKTDGFMVFDIDDILMIETDNAYIKEIDGKLGAELQYKSLNVKYNGNDLLKDFIHTVFEKEKIIEIELMHSNLVDIRGKILNVKNNYIEIEALDEEDNPDGKSYCRIKDISMVYCNL